MTGELLPRQVGIGGAPLASVGYIYLENSQVSVNGDIFTINGRAYELDDLGVAAVGDVAVTVPDGSNPAVTGAALVADINGDGSRTVDALLLSTDIVGLISLTDLAPTLAETSAKGVVSAAAMVGNSDGDGELVFHQYTVTAADVVALLPGTQDGSIPIIGVRSTTMPQVFSISVYQTSGDKAVQVSDLTNLTFVWKQFNTNFWALIMDDGANADVAAGDVINLIIQLL